MNREAVQVPLSTFFVITIISQLVFTIPAVIIILVFNLLQLEAFLFIALPTILISIPIGAYFSWLMAKGSNWVNTKAAVVVSSIFPGRFFGVLLGGLLGYRFYGMIGGALFIILFFLGTNLLGRFLGELLVEKLIPEMNR